MSNTRVQRHSIGTTFKSGGKFPKVGYAHNPNKRMRGVEKNIAMARQTS
jgi:hypothetical protein